MSINHRLIRTVPAETSDEVEQWWARACEMHPTFHHVTFRDPVDPVDFPKTSPSWDLCTSGAQRAGLIRLEALYWMGGIYLDSDVELYRPLTPLLGVEAFACWEDAGHVPDAVLAAHRWHPAIAECINLALARLPTGASESGPMVTTAILPGRDDVLLLPPGSFYEVHYTEKHRLASMTPEQAPWAFGLHHWHGSWLDR